MLKRWWVGVWSVDYTTGDLCNQDFHASTSSSLVMIAGNDQTITLSLYVRKEHSTGLAVCYGAIQGVSRL